MPEITSSQPRPEAPRKQVEGKAPRPPQRPVRFLNSRQVVKDVASKAALGESPKSSLHRIADAKPVEIQDQLKGAERPVSPVLPRNADTVGLAPTPENQAKSEAPLSEASMSGYIGSIARIADNAIAENKPEDLQLAINGLPDNHDLRRRVNEILRAKGIKVESKDEAKQADRKDVASDTPHIDYEDIARNLRLDEVTPPVAEGIMPLVGGNFFADSDTPTLAGKLAARVYSQLIERGDMQERPEKVISEDEKGRADFLSYVRSINLERVQKGLLPFNLSKKHTVGVDDFHVDGKGYLDDFEFYFNKSSGNWKNPQGQLFRGYITIDPQKAGDIQREFVDLVQVLYDAGIDFTAKASGFYGATKRTDNMVFYISPPDQAQASGLMKKFLAARGVGQGHVLAAAPSAQEGLSWAADPDKTQTQVWQDVAGSTTEASFNGYVAARLMPTYLTRIADAHERKGNREQAKIFRAEALRTKTVVDRLKPSL